MHRATSVWVFITRGADGDEETVAIQDPQFGMMPLFNTREENARGPIADLARGLVARGHTRIELRRYEIKEVVEVFEPPRGNA